MCCVAVKCTRMHMQQIVCLGSLVGSVLVNFSAEHYGALQHCCLSDAGQQSWFEALVPLTIRILCCATACNGTALFANKSVFKAQA